MLLPKNQISLLIVILLFAGCQSKKSYKSTDNNKKDLESVLIKEQLPDRSTQVPTDSSLYKNPGLPVMDRVRNLLSYMTLEEKIGQMTQVDICLLVVYINLPCNLLQMEMLLHFKLMLMEC